ncbi:PFL_4703 family integrating conjugative element protein [Endothiovibrio diazotrophicus]
MKGPFLNADHNRLAHVATLRVVAGGLALLLALSLFLNTYLTRTQTVSLPPDLRNGATRELGRTYPHDAWAFALVVWQQLYHWGEDGRREYAANIRTLAPYLTERCQRTLREDHGERLAAGELQGRTRALQQLSAYAPEAVTPVGGGTWRVTLEFRVRDTVNGVPIKEPVIRYPIRVVERAEDSERNPWNLQVDCLFAAPQRVEEAP